MLIQRGCAIACTSNFNLHIWPCAGARSSLSALCGAATPGRAYAARAGAAIATTRALGGAAPEMPKGGRAGAARSKRAAPSAGGGGLQERPPSRAGSGAAAAAAAGGRPLLLDLGELVVGKVLRRPSTAVRTPYVADVELTAGGQQVLAHTPALDCAGLIVPGATVRMTANAPRKKGAAPTRTTHAVQIAEEPREGGGVALVGAHPALAEALAEAALRERLIPELGAYTRVLRQQTFGSTRVDFVLEREGGGLLLLEVKNVVCADYPEGGVPPGRSKVGVYTSAAVPYTRTAIFPHGARKKGAGVVSDRAIKHAHELTQIQAAGTLPELPPRVAAALGRGGGGGGGGGAAGVPVTAAVLFVVNRSDCAAFRPCHEACPLLAQVLKRAEAAGVALLAYSVEWEGGEARWGRRLPVVFGAGVDADVDEDHLSRVLEFNATDPRTHWKKAAAGAAAAAKAARGGAAGPGSKRRAGAGGGGGGAEGAGGGGGGGAMELELHRVDLLQTAAAAPGALAVLPPGEKKTQKVAVGDASGVVQCFSVKRGDVALSFKTMPGPHKVTSVTVGRHPRQRDKIFVAAGNTIRGMTKKGKEFFRFTTSLTEPIARLAVTDRDVWASCEFVHSHFIEARDKGLYLAPDRILAAEVIPLLGPGEMVPVLACRDCMVRVLEPGGAAPLFEVPTPSPPTALLHVADSHDPRHRFPAASHEVLYGCEDGRVVQLMVERAAVRQGFTIPAPPGAGAVRVMHCGADYSKSGCADIVVGREDGRLEVWDVDEAGCPQKVFSTQLLESICSVDGGYVTSAAAADIIVIAFSPSAASLALGAPAAAAGAGGAAAGLLPQLAGLSFKDKGAQGAGGGGGGGGGGGALGQHQQLVAALHERVSKATAEVDALRRKLEEAKARSQARPAGAAAPQGAAAALDVSHSLKLLIGGGGGGGGAGGENAASSGVSGSGGGACYALSLESAAPLFAVGLACSRELQLLDAPGNVAILSRTTPPEHSGWATLATYRCQDATNRLTLCFRAREGGPGVLKAYVVPAIAPKTCGIVQYRLAPLCLYQRTSADVIELWQQQQQQQTAAVAAGQLPFSELMMSGSFSLQEVHSWVAAALPDLPPHAPTAAGGGEARYSFRSCQAGSLLGCSIAAGAARFVSDNISALALLHDSLMRSATADKVRASSSFAIHPRGLDHAAHLLWPDLEMQRGRARRARLLQALQAQYREMLDQAAARGGAGAAEDGGGGGGAARAGSGAARAPELEAAEEAVRQLFRDHLRLGGGGGGGGGGKARAAGLDALLSRAGDAGARLEDAVAFMRGGG
ncbi:MAG: hypothetical protein J3K34DRAFT_522137 [Monoraphidium minutum]|nr:MAG: hypothetical protein J3K34DRAFT_522137 [Monoraphidium minutum]